MRVPLPPATTMASRGMRAVRDCRAWDEKEFIATKFRQKKSADVLKRTVGAQKTGVIKTRTPRFDCA
jgi:hypothetical protein